MTLDILLMLVLVVATLVAFVRELFPVEVTALGLLSLLLVSRVVSPEEAIAGFSNKAVVTIGGLFILSHALLKTGVPELATDHLSRRLIQKKWLAVGILLASVSLLSGFLNNTAVVAMFIPLTISFCHRLRINPSKLLIPVSYASIFGGTLTLIGTSTNLLVSAIVEDSGQPSFTMFELTKLGAVFLALGVGYLLVFAPRMLPQRAAEGALTSKYLMGPYLTEVRIVAESKLLGKTCEQVRINERYDITVLAILRGESRLTERLRVQPLRVGDILIVRGPVDNILRLRSEQGVALLPDIKLTDKELSAGGQVMAEALVPRNSSMIGKTLKEVGFRWHYGGFVLAIRRLGATLRAKIAHTRLRFSDTLLIVVSKDRLNELRRSEDFIVLSEATLELKRGRFWWAVMVLLPMVVLASALGILDITPGVLLACVALLMLGAVTPQEAYRAVDWSVLILIAAFVPVSGAFVSSGTADFIAAGLVRFGALFPATIAPHAALALLYLITAVLTQMISNNAAAIILAPIGLSLAVALGVDARPFVMAICFAASAGFMTPIGYQTNTMVYGPGNYRFLDYTRFGVPLNLLFWLVASLLIPRMWSF